MKSERLLIQIPRSHFDGTRGQAKLKSVPSHTLALRPFDRRRIQHRIRVRNVLHFFGSNCLLGEGRLEAMPIMSPTIIDVSESTNPGAIGVRSCSVAGKSVRERDRLFSNEVSLLQARAALSY